MNKKQSKFIFIIIILLFTIYPLNNNAQQTNDWWDTKWSYRQEIILPDKIDYSSLDNQPIDMRIYFSQPCWAKNETTHSIRIIKQNGRQFQELESQVYSIKQQSKTTIQACNIVFLLPENTVQSDIFYIYYDESETLQPNYIDHVSIKDSSYYYEPISGYPLSSKFYHIIQDGYSVYALSQEGRFMDYFTAQSITKLSESTTTVSPNSGESVASFDYSFFYGDTLDDSYTTSRNLVSKRINTDGNLMVSCTIKSTSQTNDMFSTVTYTYYYCPTPEKRIFAQVNHEIQNAYTISDNVLTDGIYATLFISSVKSAAIEQLNFGKIPQYIHFINDNNEFKEYTLDPNPPYISTGECIPVISKEQDQDLSSNPWICFDDGINGEAHAVIFNTTQVIRSGIDEKDGVQIKAYELDSPHLPGFENNMAVILLGRNSYEPAQGIDTKSPKDFRISFNAEYYSTPNGGYPMVVDEATTFQMLSSLRHQNDENQEIEYEKEQTYDLTVFVHNAHTLPQSQALSILTGLNLSYIQVEVYQNDTLICSGSPTRIHLRSQDASTDAARLLPINRWDIRNTSLFKSITFTDLSEGYYVIKIMRYHPILFHSSKFIGVKNVQIPETTTTHIYCTDQRIIEIIAIDQRSQPVQNVEARIKTNGATVSIKNTDEKGKTTLSVPTLSTGSYHLSIYYKGFLISEEEIQVRRILSKTSLKKEIQLDHYDLILNFKDTWGLAPSMKLYPTIQSKEQKNPYNIKAEQWSQGTYIFESIPPASYMIKNPSNSVEKTIDIKSDTNLTILLTDTYKISYSLFNKRGLPIDLLYAHITREDKTKEYELKNETGLLQLPQGTYKIDIKSKDSVISSRYIQVLSESSIDIVTNTDPLNTTNISIIIISLILITLFIFLKYKTYHILLSGLITVLVLLLITMPWWTIQGETKTIERVTSFYSVPPALVTMYTTNSIQTGELAGLPSILNITFLGCIGMITIGAIGYIIWMIYLQKKLRSQFTTTIILILLALIIGAGFIGNTIALVLLSDVAIGGFFGHAPVEIMIPGQADIYSIQSTWGPFIGWFSALILFTLIWIQFIFQLKQKKSDT